MMRILVTIPRFFITPDILIEAIRQRPLIINDGRIVYSTKWLLGILAIILLGGSQLY